MTREIKIESSPMIVRTGYQVNTITVRASAGGVVSVPVVAVPVGGTVTARWEVTP